jgi:hypothetical protein
MVVEILRDVPFIDCHEFANLSIFKHEITKSRENVSVVQRSMMDGPFALMTAKPVVTGQVNIKMMP